MLGASSTKVIVLSCSGLRCVPFKPSSPSRLTAPFGLASFALRFASWSVWRRVAPVRFLLVPAPRPLVGCAADAPARRSGQCSSEPSRSLPGACGRSAPDHRIGHLFSASHPRAVAASGGLAAESEPGDRIAELGVQDLKGDYQRSKPHDERAQEQHDDRDGPAPPRSYPWLPATRSFL